MFAFFSNWTRHRPLPGSTPISSQGRISWEDENLDPILPHLEDERENGGGVTIYRVPSYIKQLISPEDFTPQELFVGFYLHTELKVDELDIDISKLAILREFCKGSATDGPPTSLTKRAEAWTELVSKVDADAMTGARSKFTAKRYAILRDLLILENQIPVTLLKVMVQCLRRPSTPETADSMLHNLLEWFVMAIYPFDHGTQLDLQQHLQSNHKDQGLDSFISCDHLLHCAYLAICGPERYPISDGQSRSGCRPNVGLMLPCFRSGEEDLEVGICESEESFSKFIIPSATSLRRVGIKVRVTDDSLTLPSIEFVKQNKFVLWHEYILLVPKLKVHGDTASMFRNLALYEQIKDDGYCHRGDMRNYLYLMNCLLNTVEDVQLLINTGVILNLLGSAEAVYNKWKPMFYGLYIPNEPPRYWGELQKAFRELQKSKSNRWLAEFRDRHLSSAVIFASSVIFFVIFIATVGQTIYAVLAYYVGN
ncbi:hypothetical protein R1sor_022484 [Riccia sorocarpa]|uniref:Uncharacterized protein n=1 Tax=Riccia sorocarpa TaxID=122646 RepID=A0ABD3GJZ5_9MARC